MGCPSPSAAAPPPPCSRTVETHGTCITCQVVAQYSI
uniref:Uncharacterized protein n=1 Tax=Arundo donax TaxID=35708 RepID=A0A0A8Z295_ARUDO